MQMRCPLSGGDGWICGVMMAPTDTPLYTQGIRIRARKKRRSRLNHHHFVWNILWRGDVFICLVCCLVVWFYLRDSFNHDGKALVQFGGIA